MKKALLVVMVIVSLVAALVYWLARPLPEYPFRSMR